MYISVHYIEWSNIVVHITLYSMMKGEGMRNWIPKSNMRSINYDLIFKGILKSSAYNNPSLKGYYSYQLKANGFVSDVTTLIPDESLNQNNI